MVFLLYKFIIFLLLQKNMYKILVEHEYHIKLMFLFHGHFLMRTEEAIVF